MTDVTLYDEPFPKPDSVVDEDPCCDVWSHGNRGFGCTRELDHPGDHQACGPDNLMVASWPNGAAS